MTTQQINSIPENKIVSVSDKVGKLGNKPVAMIMKQTDIDYKKMTETEVFIVVTRQGILNYWGNALVAAYEGKEGVDYMKFKTAIEVSKFLS